MSKQLSIDDIRERIVSTEKVAHVTFYLVRDELDEDRFLIYSESKDKGLDILRNEHRLYLGESIPYNDALTVLGDAIQLLEKILERKRKGPPTPKQVYFLFREKIPIPLTLTWGEASDLIDERLSQKEYEKEVRRQALLDKFNGFIVGMSVYQPRTRYIAIGKITKLTSNKTGVRYAYVQWENKDYTSRETIDTLYKTQAEAESVQQFATGDRVRHAMFGSGLILSSEVQHGKELVCILFDKPVLVDGRREGSFYTTSKQLQKTVTMERAEDDVNF